MLVLASNSPQRLELLKQAGIEIGRVISPNIDEKPLKSELPLSYVRRMALQKCYAVKPDHDNHVLTADTIVVCGRRILGQPQNKEIAEQFLRLISGRKHRVTTSVCLAHKGEMRVRTVITVVKMKRLSSVELGDYLDSGEWKGKAGGYAIQGIAAKFIPSISGSYTNVVGLPLTETINLLLGNGFLIDNKAINNE